MANTLLEPLSVALRGAHREVWMVHETLSLVPDPTAPALARHRLRDLLLGLPDAILADALLLTTEVLTNSLRHSDVTSKDRIHVALDVSPSALRVAITDPGIGEWFVPRRPNLHATGGRGLLLVAEMADRWGVDRDQATTVWFELSLASRVASRAG
jgi:serine/threonine-protein kinase RsbW